MVEGESDIRVPDSELDYNEELIYRYKGKPFSGIGYDDDGALATGRSEIRYREGLQDGLSQDWYVSGRLRSEAYYCENTLHGQSREFDEDGTVRSEVTYEYGIAVHRVARDPSGKIACEWRISESDPGYDRLEKYRAVKEWPNPPQFPSA